MPREKEYELAERRIREVLGSAGSAFRPHEIVEHLSCEEGIPADVGSTAMWELIGDGEVELSNEWYVSLGR